MPGGFFLILRGFQIRCGRAILAWIPTESSGPNKRFIA